MDPVRLKVPLAGSNSSADASELSPLVVVALAERLDEPKLATLDQRHFRVVRPSHVASLELRP